MNLRTDIHFILKTLLSFQIKAGREKSGEEIQDGMKSGKAEPVTHLGVAVVCVPVLLLG